MSASALHLLEGDGVVSNLFFYIWRKKAMGKSAPAVDLSVPSTVVFEHNFPKAWYYTHCGEIERKLGKDVDSQQILRDFLRPNASVVAGEDGEDASHGHVVRRGHGGANDVVATYLSSEEEDGKPCTRVEFFNEAELKEFLLKRTRRRDGILQKWVWASGKQNAVIEAIWSPYVCLVTKRENKTPIRDRKVPIYDRAITYEGPLHFSEDVFVAPHIKWQVEHICQELVEHLLTTQKIAVQRMVLYFKVDCNSQIWMLWSSSMRIVDKSLVNLSPRFVRTVKVAQEEERLTAERISRLLRETLDEETATLPDSMRPSIIQPTPPKIPTKLPRRKKSPLRTRASAKACEPGIAFPAAPSMGPIGDIFTEFPEWSARYKEQKKEEARRARKEARKRRKQAKKQEAAAAMQPHPPPSQSAGESFPHRTQAEEATATPTAGPKRRRRRRNRRKKSDQQHRSQSPLQQDLQQHGSNSPRSCFSCRPVNEELEKSVQDSMDCTQRPNPPRSAKYLWAIVRVAVLSSAAVLRITAKEINDWAANWVYTVYSHCLCVKNKPLLVTVPRRYNEMLCGKAKWLLRKRGETFYRPPRRDSTCATEKDYYQYELDRVEPAASASQEWRQTDKLPWISGMNMLPLGTKADATLSSSTPLAGTADQSHNMNDISVSPSSAGGDQTVISPMTEVSSLSASTSEDDAMLLRVTAMKSSLFEIQATLKGYLEREIDRPAAKAWWFFVAQKELLRRRYEKQQQPASS